MSFSRNEYIGHNVSAKLLMEICDTLSLDKSQIPPTLPKPLPQRRHYFAFPTPQTNNPYSPLIQTLFKSRE